MIKYLFVLLVFFIFSNAGYAQNKSLPIAKEYMDTDSLLILNQLSIVVDKDKLIALFGPPDSTVVRNQGEMCINYFFRSCPNQFKVLIWDKTKVETCNNKAVVQVINFKGNPKLFVTYAGKIRLSSETSIDLLKKYYPNSIKNLHKVDVHQEGSFKTIAIPSKKVGAESAWILFFQKNKLVRMDYWRPC